MSTLYATRVLRTTKVYTYLVITYKPTLWSWLTRGDHYEEHLIKDTDKPEEFVKKVKATGIRDPRDKKHWITLVTDVYDITEESH